jgi:hypothetical protein
VIRSLQTPTASPDNPDGGQFFTKKELHKRQDWQEWQQSIYKMLDQYQGQGMFSDPVPLPKESNALHMHWVYCMKICGTRKACMVCNGSPRQKGTNTLGHTYANALDAASERLFWAICASENLIAIGADVSNAFAEAPLPKAPLYLYIDESFRDWWVNHLKCNPIPKECDIVRINNAIQGHPESPRLWEKHIDQILRKLSMTPTTHEPCMYQGTINGERIIFLRQVDDFAVASKHQKVCYSFLDTINGMLQIPLKTLGVVQ